MKQIRNILGKINIDWSRARVEAVEMVLLFGLFGILLFMTGHEDEILFPCAGVLLYLVMDLLRKKLPQRRFLIVCAVAGVLAAVVLAAGWETIYSGAASVLNDLYDMGEEAQAYVYNHIEAGEYWEGPTWPAVLWASCVAGFLLSLIPGRFRKWTMTGLFLAVMGFIAFMGIEPEGIFVVIAMAALMLILAESRAWRAFLPLALVLVLVIGGIMALDPGESTAVSRANEQIRDRIALHTVRIPTYGSSDYWGDDETEDMDSESGNEEQDESKADAMDLPSAGHMLMILAGTVVLLLLVAAALFYRRLRKKRARNRAGLDSTNATDAITAIFPYTVKWLHALGLPWKNAPFSETVPTVGEMLSAEYAEEYQNMLTLWKEAVYSEHPMTETARNSMEGFSKRTIEIVQKRLNWREKLKVRFLTAL